MSYVYLRPDKDTCWVGFYEPDGDFHIESEHDSPEAAARRVNYLNGGAPDIGVAVGQALGESSKITGDDATAKLSPAAQAAIDAAWSETPMSPDGPYFTRCRQLAAAFKAVANAVLPDTPPPTVPKYPDCNQAFPYHEWIVNRDKRREILAIAKELDELEPEDE